MRGLGTDHVVSEPMRGLEKNCNRWHKQTDRQTDKQTDGHGNSLTELDHKANSVKIKREWKIN